MSRIIDFTLSNLLSYFYYLIIIIIIFFNNYGDQRFYGWHATTFTCSIWNKLFKPCINSCYLCLHKSLFLLWFFSSILQKLYNLFSFFEQYERSCVGVRAFFQYIYSIIYQLQNLHCCLSLIWQTVHYKIKQTFINGNLLAVTWLFAESIK